MKGRKFNGVRGWAGKPSHPPLTDVPVAAYVIVGAFDLISYLGAGTAWDREFYQAATFVLVAGALVSLGTATTGFFDWWRSSEPDTQARRTLNAHAVIMVTVTVIVLVDLGLRWLRYHSGLQPPGAVLGISLAAAVLVALGSTYGGTLVFGYGLQCSKRAGTTPSGTVPKPTPSRVAMASTSCNPQWPLVGGEQRQCLIPMVDRP